jgi:hypothetical protein
MRFQKFSFGAIRIDGVTYEHDVVIDRGDVRKRKVFLWTKKLAGWVRLDIEPRLYSAAASRIA